MATVIQAFVNNAQLSSKAFGMWPCIPLATLPRALTNLKPEEVEADTTDEVRNMVVAGLTKAPSGIAITTEKERSHRFQAGDLLEAAAMMNRGFLETGWSDGFPLVPATEEAVAAMLAGSPRQAKEDIITVLEPGMGLATVEKIAINAVMAGCVPEHLPVLIAAIKAISRPSFRLRAVAMSTGPHAPLLVINGPVAKRLKINSGMGALGPGAQSWANTVIGRALRLILMNIGQAYVGKLDLDTMGSPNKYSMAIAENEEANPWQPLHVERGFGQNESTVTAFSVESLVGANVQNPTGEGILKGWANTINMAAATTTKMVYTEGREFHSCLLIAPDHARVLYSDGYLKDDIRRYLFLNAQISWGVLKAVLPLTRMTTGWRWLLKEPDDRLLPVVGGPEWFHIVVVGGPVGKSSYITGDGHPVTERVEFEEQP